MLGVAHAATWEHMIAGWRSAQDADGWHRGRRGCGDAGSCLPAAAAPAAGSRQPAQWPCGLSCCGMPGSTALRHTQAGEGGVTNATEPQLPSHSCRGAHHAGAMPALCFSRQGQSRSLHLAATAAQLHCPGLQGRQHARAAPAAAQVSLTRSCRLAGGILGRPQQRHQKWHGARLGNVHLHRLVVDEDAGHVVWASCQRAEAFRAQQIP